MRKRGQSLVELVTGLILLIPMVLVVFDLTMIVIAIQKNNSICREAARVASSGDPSAAQIRADEVVERSNETNAGIISNFELVSVDMVPVDTISRSKALQPYGGSISGTITVNTEITVTPFFVQYIGSGGKPLKFRSQQSFPFTYVVPNPAANNTERTRNHRTCCRLKLSSSSMYIT